MTTAPTKGPPQTNLQQPRRPQPKHVPPKGSTLQPRIVKAKPADSKTTQPARTKPTPKLVLPPQRTQQSTHAESPQPTGCTEPKPSFDSSPSMIGPSTDMPTPTQQTTTEVPTPTLGQQPTTDAPTPTQSQIGHPETTTDATTDMPTQPHLQTTTYATLDMSTQPTTDMHTPPTAETEPPTTTANEPRQPVTTQLETTDPPLHEAITELPVHDITQKMQNRSLRFLNHSS